MTKLRRIQSEVIGPLPTKRMSGGETKRLKRFRDEAYFEQKGKCHWCEVHMTRIWSNRFLPHYYSGEHLKSRSKGGKTTKENVVAACCRCNSSHRNEESVNEKL